MLTTEIANEIVKQTMLRLNRNINIMDQSGKIIASGNQERLGQIHEGSLEVLRTGNTLILNEGTDWEGSRPGVNLPIEFQNKIIGVIGITGNPAEIMEFGELTKMITEMMIHQAFWATKLESKQRVKDMMFDELLQGKTVEQRLDFLQIKLTEPYQVGVIEIGETKENKLGLINIVEESLSWRHSFVGFSSVNRLFLCFSGKESDKVRKKVSVVANVLARRGISFRIGLGTSVMNVTDLCKSYEEATRALAFGHQDEPYTYYEEIEIKALLQQLSSEEKEHYWKRIIGNIPEKWIETLEAFFSHNQNIGESADALYIHRNTLIYRLKKIKEQTDLDPQIFHDAVALQMAVWMRKYEES